MTRIAVISDIHSNPMALDAVIDDIERQSVDEVLVGGDLVGRGPLGSAVVERIIDSGWACVRGNHEDYLINFWREDVPPQWLETDQWAASRWMAAELDESHIEYMDSLPFTISSRIEPSLRLFHGSPESHSDGIGEWTSESKLERHWNAIDEHVLACAHTHRPLVRRVKGGLIVNVGSVGLPFNGDPRAQYAIFTYEDGDWDVDFAYVEYDRDTFLQSYDSTGFLEEGDVTAQLLKMEVEHARPFLVPFLKWTEYTGRSTDQSSIEPFLDVYNPECTMQEFFELLQREKSQ
jgi:predicted phosphodiesterase